MGKKKTEKKKIYRRDFLKGMATGAVGITAGSLLSGHSSVVSAKTTKVSASLIPASWDMDADVVVLGYGGSGIVAAIEVVDGG